MVERMLYLYEYVDAPYDDVTEVLAERGSGLFQEATDAAVAHADTVRGEVVVDLAGFEVGRDVVIDVGAFEPVEAIRAKLHLDWRAAEASTLFPSLSADLEVAALSFHPPVTQVTLVGHYDPPLGLLGAAVDRLFAHRVAEAALHRFLHTVTDRIEQEIGAVEHAVPS